MSKTLVNFNGTSRKFWTVTVANRAVLCSWGRIGSWRQSKAFNFASAYEAMRYAELKISQKVNHDYDFASERVALDLS